MEMRRIGCVTLFLFWLYLLPAQDRVTLSGDVSDSLSKETLLGVTILIQELNTGTVTNNYGFYSVSVHLVITRFWYNISDTKHFNFLSH